VIPVVDLARRWPRHRDAFLATVDRIGSSGALLLGQELVAFEAELGAFTGHDHCVGVASGAAALQLVMAARGIGPGDEVVVPAHTAVPTAAAVCAVGATPVFADVDPATAALTTATVERVVTDRTRLVIAVHLYGRPCELPAVGIDVLEDAAQAHGALLPPPPGERACSVATAYSAYPTKNMGGIGDGGAIVTQDPELAATLRRLRLHGMREQYVHVDVSQNFRMSEIEAAWLRLVLPEIGTCNARRAEIARRYRSAAPHLRWHDDHERHVFHLCVVRVDDRDGFRAALAEHGVGTGVHYPLALTQQPAYRHLTTAACSEAEAWAAECVSLPCFPELTDVEVDAVCAALSSVQ
jgi:dTDP-4-amino-4,6-dideoxygalactose transaminase